MEHRKFISQVINIKNTYSPYLNFKVKAAVLIEDGNVYSV